MTTRHAIALLPPGKKTQGFVYLERGPATDGCDLCWDLWTAKAQRPQTTLCISFEVR